MDIKKELFWGLLITLIVLLLTIYYVWSFQNVKSGLINRSSLNTKISSIKVVLTSSEVSKHNTESDCWFVIDNKVYNATSYIDLHPRGKKLLLPYCGQDATEGYQTKGGEGTHSTKADTDLLTLYIGDLNGQKIK